MQKTIYICDGCGKEIKAGIHLSLNMNLSFTGVAIPPGLHFTTIPVVGVGDINELPWKVFYPVNHPTFLHLHDETCASTFFKNLITLAKANYKL